MKRIIPVIAVLCCGGFAHAAVTSAVWNFENYSTQGDVFPTIDPVIIDSIGGIGASSAAAGGGLFFSRINGLGQYSAFAAAGESNDYFEFSFSSLNYEFSVEQISFSLGLSPTNPPGSTGSWKLLASVNNGDFYQIETGSFNSRDPVALDYENVTMNLPAGTMSDLTFRIQLENSYPMEETRIDDVGLSIGGPLAAVVPEPAVGIAASVILLGFVLYRRRMSAREKQMSAS